MNSGSTIVKVQITFLKAISLMKGSLEMSSFVCFKITDYLQQSLSVTNFLISDYPCASSSSKSCFLKNLKNLCHIFQNISRENKSSRVRLVTALVGGLVGICQEDHTIILTCKRESQRCIFQSSIQQVSRNIHC